MIDVLFSFPDFQDFDLFYEFVIRKHPEYLKSVCFCGVVFRNYMKGFDNCSTNHVKV